ncbi:hypothetical protein CYMTET_31480 [Cymbomonas tetramitiformis]|uniref:Uncharacterized protein n=1 Tax=Cymbomonas tetramitiformis TaxID=36881 RepID=A0AAE0KSU3_9CHLO|nr:hypothetical protein CYMTET_31480 [Cymbomonas tetramitiformis]
MLLKEFCEWQDTVHIPTLVLNKTGDVILCNNSCARLSAVLDTALRSLGHSPEGKSQGTTFCETTLSNTSVSDAHYFDTNGTGPGIQQVCTLTDDERDCLLRTIHCVIEASPPSPVASSPSPQLEEQTVSLRFRNDALDEKSHAVFPMSVGSCFEKGEKYALLVGLDTASRRLLEVAALLLRKTDCPQQEHTSEDTIIQNPPSIGSEGDTGSTVLTCTDNDDQPVVLNPFLANISHELRTPLNCIVGFNQLLLQSTLLTTEQRQWVTLSQTSCKSLLSLVGTILDFHRANSGNFVMKPKDFDLRGMTEETCELITSVAVMKNLELICLISPNVPTKVNGDPILIRQVLLNVISNSIKFTEEGEVILRVNVLPTTEKNCLVEFTIQDTGSGMAAEDITKLFKERYVDLPEHDKTDRKAKQKDSGSRYDNFGSSGLGLAITGQLLQLMGGSVQVESEINVGSKFVITIPLQHGLKSTTSEELSHDLMSNFSPYNPIFTNGLPGNIRFCIISGSTAMQQFLQEMLSSWGCSHFEPFMCPEKAFEFLSSQKIQDDEPSLCIIESISSIDELWFTTQVHLDNSDISCDKILLAPPDYMSLARQVPDISWTVMSKPVKTKSLLECLLYLNHVESRKENSTTQPNILLVEDCHVLQASVSHLLREIGMQVIVVGNGLEALRVIVDGKISISLCIMDYHMPGKDGVETIKLFREIYGNTLPVIGITSSYGDCERMVQAGADEYLLKPLKKSVLMDAVKKYTKTTAFSQCVLLYGFETKDIEATDSLYEQLIKGHFYVEKACGERELEAFFFRNSPAAFILMRLNSEHSLVEMLQALRQVTGTCNKYSQFPLLVGMVDTKLKSIQQRRGYLIASGLSSIRTEQWMTNLGSIGLRDWLSHLKLSSKELDADWGSMSGKHGTTVDLQKQLLKSVPPSSAGTTLDVGSVMPPQKNPPVAFAPEGRSSRILVVDDNVINHRVLCAMLRSLGQTDFALAVNGKLAVEEFTAALDIRRFDVIFMDIEMPVMNGYEATRIIREVCIAPAR